MVTCSEGALCSLAVQMPDVIATDAHVFPLTKAQATSTAESTRWVETLLSSLVVCVHGKKPA